MLSLFPSLIAAKDMAHLGDLIARLEPFCAGFHLDIMDNHFVPNLTFGPLVVNSLAQCTTKPFWVHVMADNCENVIAALELPPESTVSFHIESKNNFENIIHSVKEKKLKLSVALNPKTALETIFPYIQLVDSVLLMSVEPGFSGQPFLPGSIKKLAALRRYRLEQSLSFLIGMDGGITVATLAQVVQEGCDMVAVGSAVFDQPDMVGALRALYERFSHS